ncbi:MAG: hypothetical protein O6766_02250 [Gammaproteobacteria bacterium]|nr:hypothetical protein [Gammaproteobacteria bacterium]MCZ6708928.1 hypothetical protein [Gammaproteobacteria bacterium]
MKKLLLIGGGHSHVEVMRGFGLRSAADISVTVVMAETGALLVDEVLPEQGAGPMVARGGSVVAKKRAASGEQGQLARICAAQPRAPACAGAFFVKDLTGDRLRTPFTLPMLG